MYAKENTADQSDMNFVMGDNAESDNDRYVFWQKSFLGVAEDRFPLVMSAGYSAFGAQYVGNVSTAPLGGATVYINNRTNRMGIGTIAPRATLHNAGSTIFEALVVTNLATG